MHYTFQLAAAVLLLPTLLATAYPTSRIHIRSPQTISGEYQLYKYPSSSSSPLTPLRKVTLWQKEDAHSSDVISYNIVWTEKAEDKNGRPATVMQVSNDQLGVAVEILKQVNLYIESAQDDKKKVWVIFSRPDKPGKEETQTVEFSEGPGGRKR